MVISKWPAIALLTLGTALMQYHTIPFWIDMAGQHLIGLNLPVWATLFFDGKWVGIAWSITIEFSALWLWWQSGQVVHTNMWQRLLRVVPVRVLAIVASVLVMAGPLFLLTAPIQKEYREIRQHELQLAQLEILIADEKADKVQFRENSAKRRGWADRIDESRSRLQGLQTQKQQLIASAPKSVEIALYVKVAYQITVLIVVMVVQIMAISSLHGETKGADSSSKESLKHRITRLQLAMLHNPGTQKEMADGAGVEVRDIQRVLGHFKPGVSPVPVNRIEKMESFLT